MSTIVVTIVSFVLGAAFGAIALAALTAAIVSYLPETE